MEIVKLVPTSPAIWNRFMSYIHEELDALKENHFAYEIYSKEASLLCIECTAYPSHLSIPEVLGTFRYFLSRAVSEFIIEEAEETLLQEIIKDNHQVKGEQANEVISSYCRQVLCLEDYSHYRDEDKIAGRKEKIFKQTYMYLEEEAHFNLQGFITFRLKEYQHELSNVVEYAIEEYILEEEYKNFIQFLRYIVSTQKPKLPFLHVLHLGARRFLLFNELGTLIADEEARQYLQVLTDQEVSSEDAVVSTLISLAPKRLVVHTLAPGDPVIHTLSSIFDQQLIICQDCNHCRGWRQKSWSKQGEQYK